MKHITTALLLLAAHGTMAQSKVKAAKPAAPVTLAPFQQIEVKTTPWHKRPALIYIPEAAKGERLPLILCMHGKSIAGDDVGKVFRQGVTRQVHEGKKIEAVNPKDGKRYKFVILAPLSDSWGLSPDQVNAVLDDVLKRYPIDSNRIYITGYSAGGWAVAMAVTDAKLSKRLAAAVNMSPAAIEEPNMSSFRNTARANLPTWYFAGAQEQFFYDRTKMYIDSTNKYKRGLTRLSIGDHAHCCWEKYFNPAFRENGTSIYEWMLQFKR